MHNTADHIRIRIGVKGERKKGGILISASAWPTAADLKAYLGRAFLKNGGS